MRSVGSWLLTSWMTFWFKPMSPAPVCVYRFFFGLIVAVYGCMYMTHAATWFGPNGMFEPAVLGPRAIYRLNVLLWLQADDNLVYALVALLIAAGLSLSVGFLTRACSIIVWILLVSFQHRDPFVLNIGDYFLRIMAFPMMFAPAGAMYSVDAAIREARHPERRNEQPVTSEPWTLRMMQLEVAFMYAQAFITKLQGRTWLDGTAVYFATHISAFQHLALPPWLDSPIIYAIATYGTLLVEFSLFTLVWNRKLRYWVLAAGICLHVGIELLMTLPMLVYIFTSAYILFVYPEDCERVAQFLGRPFRRLRARHAATT